LHKKCQNFSEIQNGQRNSPGPPLFGEEFERSQLLCIRKWGKLVGSGRENVPKRKQGEKLRRDQEMRGLLTPEVLVTIAT
jgi:hypothetical protein